MTKLPINQSEALVGGQDADCVGAVASGIGLIITAGETIGVAAAGLAVHPIGWIALGVGIISVVASNWNGAPCENV
ncbi:MAG: hypothetical protein AAF694_10540 [Bacteroidota bacterium]